MTLRARVLAMVVGAGAAVILTGIVYLIVALADSIMDRGH